MKLKEFTVETWMTDHELDCQYNLAETCVASMSLRELAHLTHKDLVDQILDIRMDYGPITGSLRLKKAILSLYKSGNEENLTITHGAINANELVMLTLLEPGDHVIALTPTYQQFYSFPESLGCTYDLIPLEEEKNWMPSIDDFKKVITNKTKMILLNSPNNPTGTVIGHELMMSLIALAKEYDCYIMIDEIYRGMREENPLCESISDLYERGIATASLSKIYSFAGLRLGWVKADKSIIEAINLRRDYTIISSGAFSDEMAATVLENKDVLLKRSRSIVATNKAILKAWLAKEKRITCVIPEDGTVCFLHYHFDMPSKQLCEQLQEDTGVFFVPGACFDKEYHLRFGFTNDSTMIKEGLETFSRWMNTYLK